MLRLTLLAVVSTKLQRLKGGKEDCNEMRSLSVAIKLGYRLYPGHRIAEKWGLGLGGMATNPVHGSPINGSKQNSNPWRVKVQRMLRWEDFTFLFYSRSSSSQTSRLLSSFGALVDSNRVVCTSLQDGSLQHRSLAGFVSTRSLRVFSHSPVGASSEASQDAVDINIRNQSADILSNTVVREAALSALKEHLIDVKSASPENAEFMSRNCPTFLAKLTASATSSSVAEDNLKRLESSIPSFIVNEEREAVKDSTDVVSLGYLSTGRLTLGDMMLLFNFPLALTKHGGFLKNMAILDSLGWSRHKLREMVERNSKLSTWTAEEFQINICVLEKLGVKKKDMQSFIEDPSVFTLDMGERLSPLLMYLDEIGIQWHVLGDLMKFNPQGLIKMPLANFKERVDFLLELGLSSAEVERSMRLFPQLVHLRLLNLTQKIEYFDGIGVDKDSMVKIVAKLPSIFRHSIEKNLVPKVEMLQSLGVERNSLVKFIAQYPQFFGCSMENLKQKLAFFETNGLTGQRLVKMITWHPRAFSFSVDANLSKKLQFLVNKGFPIRSTAMVRALASCITISTDALEARFQNLCTLGFTHKEVGELVRKQPTIFCLSEKTIRVKIDYLVTTMNRSTSEILKCPGYLLYSLEVRIKPRQRVVALLTSKGKLRVDVYSLSTILQPSEKTFLERFVKLDPECFDVYLDKVEEPVSNELSTVDEVVSSRLARGSDTPSSLEITSSIEDLDSSGKTAVAMT